MLTISSASSRLALILAALIGGGLSAAAPSREAIGLWRTDDGVSVVEIDRCGDRLCGRLVSFARTQDDPEANRRLCNLQVLGALAQAPDGGWTGGWVFSPEENRSYSASLRIDSRDRLELRAFVGVEAWGETLVWTRHRGPVERCAVGQ